MRLPSFKKKVSSIRVPKVNLYPGDPFFDSTSGRVIKWLVGAGRHLIIFTEVIVITSFFSRFYLDVKITDLNKLISQKQSIIESYGTLEQDFREVQNQIDEIEQVLIQQNKFAVFDLLGRSTPPEVTYGSVAFNQGSVTLQGKVTSLESLAQLVENLRTNPNFQRVVVNQIESGSQRSPEMEFSIRLIYTKALQELSSSTGTSTGNR